MGLVRKINLAVIVQREDSRKKSFCLGLAGKLFRQAFGGAALAAEKHQQRFARLIRWLLLRRARSSQLIEDAGKESINPRLLLGTERCAGRECRNKIGVH